MPITKSDIIERISAENRIPRTQANEIVDLVFDTMKEALKQGEPLQIRGFGTFRREGDEGIAFRVSQSLKDKLRQG